MYMSKYLLFITSSLRTVFIKARKNSMSPQTALLCAKCKMVLNSEDELFGTSCGHLYHFLCMRECHGKSANCSHCDAYKPSIYKMFLEFGDQPVSWEDQSKTIEIRNELEEKEGIIRSLEDKCKMTLLSVQKLENKLKKCDDALSSKNASITNLENSIAALETINTHLRKQNKLLQLNGYKENGFDLTEERLAACLNEKIDISQPLRDESNCNGNGEKHISNKVKYNESNSENSKICELNNQNDPSNNFCEDSSIISKMFETLRYSCGIVMNGNAEGNPKPIGKSCQEIESTMFLYKVVIQNYRFKLQKRWPLQDTVIYFAKKMGLKLPQEEIAKVVEIKTSYNISTIIVSFKNDNIKKKFLENKKQLKRFENTKHLKILDEEGLLPK